MSQTINEQLELGRGAHQRHQWHEAFDLLRAADLQRPLEADDLVLLAEAAWFAGDPDAAIDARERAYAGFVKVGDSCRAAEVALQLAGDHHERLENAVGNGWQARARRLLASMDQECTAHGWEAINSAMIALRITGDIELGRREAARARAIAERLDSPALRALAVQFEGMALVVLGEMTAGMALIDEATLAAVSGELDPMTTGLIYCATISVCRDVSDWRRAGEWTDAAERWCERTGISGFPGICRVHRAEVMHFRGAWADAEREARRACEELRRYDLMFSAKGLYEIGEVRRRVGDIAGARDAFRQAHELNLDPEPGLSLLRLADGDLSGAQASIRRALAASGTSPLLRARLLPAATDIALAAGDRAEPSAWVEELERIAETYRTAALRAAASYARGSLQLAEGAPEEAAAALRRAVERWHELGAPYEVARARAALALAYRASGDEGNARLELEAAKSAFERLGAIPDARRVDRELGGAGEVAARTGERVTRTFVFTDIVGSTSLAEALGDAAWDELIHWHDQTLRAHFDRHGGNEVRHTGDGFFVVFESPADAVEAAVEVQRALADHRRQHGFAPQVRIGLHQSEAAVRGMDYAGKGVHEAARIGGLAEAGEILASRETVDTGIRFRLTDLRTLWLKGVVQPIEVVSVEWR